MRKKFNAAIRGIAECRYKAFIIIMGCMSACCWQLFALFTAWFGFQTALPLMAFIPSFQTLVFGVPVFSALWCWKTIRIMKKEGGWFKLAKSVFTIFLLSLIFGAISITGNQVRLWFWIFAVVISVVVAAIISVVFLKNKTTGQVSEANEEHEEAAGSEEESEHEEVPFPESEEDPAAEESSDSGEAPDSGEDESEENFFDYYGA